MQIALVLGAGGVVGGAYLAGALTALEHDLGWDARTADVIVGTSAGALMGALLRAGIPAADLAAWTIGARLSDEARAVLGEVERPTFDPVDLRRFVRPPRLPNPRSMWSALRRPHRFDPVRAFMTHLADGSRTLAEHVEFLGEGWPDRDLYLTAVRRSDGHRTVFGRDTVPRDGVRAAVAASCAVPGYFAPVMVDGVRYIDGGVASPTNADILRERKPDLVLILSPMSTRATLPRYSTERLLRDRAGARLRREVRALEREGITTVLFEPDAEVLAHTTNDFMSEEHVRAIVGAAFLETGHLLREPAYRARLAPLRPCAAA
jgi:NTE family protein